MELNTGPSGVRSGRSVSRDLPVLTPALHLPATVSSPAVNRKDRDERRSVRQELRLLAKEERKRQEQAVQEVLRGAQVRARQSLRSVVSESAGRSAAPLHQRGATGEGQQFVVAALAWRCAHPPQTRLPVPWFPPTKRSFAPR